MENAEVKISAETQDLTNGIKEAVASIQAFTKEIAQATNAVKSSSQTMATDASTAVNKVSMEVGGIGTAFNNAEASIRQASGRISSAINGVQSVFMKFNAMLLAVTAVVQGGKMFGDAISTAKEMTGETLKLSRVLGENVTEASAFRTALGDAFITVDEFTQASAKLTMKLRENEDAVNEMGVATRGANGELLNQRQIFMNAVDTLRQYKEGTDRNAVAMELFGRSGQEALKFLKLNAEMIDQAKKKNEELNLVITDKNIKAYKEYRDAMNDFDDAMQGIKKAISEAVMPRLTEMANWFSDIAPTAIEATRKSMAYFYMAIDGLKIIVKSFYYGLSEMIDMMVIFAKVANKAFWMDWEGVKSEWDNGLAGLKESVMKHNEDIVNMARKAQEGFTYNMGKGVAVQEKPSDGGTKGYTASGDSEKQGKSLIKTFDDELAQLKLSQGSFNEFSKSQELAFWQTKLDLVASMGAKYKDQYHEIHKKVAELKIEADREALNKQIETLKFEADLDKENLKKKADLYQEIFTKVASHYPKDSQEYRQALLDKLSADKEYMQKKIQIDTELAQKERDMRLNALDIQQNDLETAVQLDLMTESQKLEALKKLEEERYQIKFDELKRELALNAGDLDKQREINNQIEELERAHALKMSQISNQIAVQAYSPWKSKFNSLESSLSSALASMMKGTLSFSNFMKGIIPTIGGAFAKMVGDMAASWVKMTVLKMAISQGWISAETAMMMGLPAVQASASTAVVGTKMAEATAVVSANSAEAATGAMASVAPIPVVGWSMAPAVFAGTLALALGAMALIKKSASGGYDIPSGVNPVTQLHAEEMVLPAHIANPLRQSLANGNTGGGGTNITIQAVDAKSIERMLKDHSSTLVKVLKGKHRNFAST